MDELIDDSKGYQPIKLPYKSEKRDLLDPPIDQVQKDLSDGASSHKVKSIIKLKETEVIKDGIGDRALDGAL